MCIIQQDICDRKSRSDSMNVHTGLYERDGHKNVGLYERLIAVSMLKQQMTFK